MKLRPNADYSYMFTLDKIAEARIAEAIERGELDNLPGSGQPLALDNDRHIPEELRVAYRILKNAGCVPPELELRREISRVEQLLIGVDDARDKNRIINKINYLLTQLDICGGTESDLRVEAAYYAKLQQKFQQS